MDKKQFFVHFIGGGEEKCIKVKINWPQIKIVNGYSTILVSMLGKARLHQIIMFYTNKIKNYVIEEQKKGSQLFSAFNKSNKV